MFKVQGSEHDSVVDQSDYSSQVTFGPNHNDSAIASRGFDLAGLVNYVYFSCCT